MKTLLLLLTIFLVAFTSHSQLIGKWKTVDDETGENKAVVQFYKKSDGKYYGKILEILKDLPFDTCEKCDGDLKGKPLIGLEFVQGLTFKGKEWSGGTLWEPKTGKSYDCKARINKSGDLEIRAYIGVPLIGRTQKWVRM